MDTTERIPECTAEQGQQWREQYSAGYRAGRYDIRFNAGLRMELIEIPAELPFETGAQYVTRHVGNAFAIGYAAAWRYELAGR
jgi:hypothetical protein